MNKIDLYYSKKDEEYLFALIVWRRHPFDNWDTCCRNLRLYRPYLFNMCDKDKLREEDVLIDSIFVEN